jgi:hypothetical protein
MPSLLSANVPGEITKTALILNPGIPYEQWQGILENLYALESGVQWWIGDALNYGEKSYGETYTQAMETTKLAYDTLAQYKWVASEYQFCDRSQLSWTHHMRVAAIEPKRRAGILKKALKEQWSVSDMKEYVSGSNEVAHVAENSGMPEWYTPAEFIKAAREVLGVIDLDPASSQIAQETVQATTYYTVEINGLVKEWRGRVWMNPPYSAGVVDKFASKLCQHYMKHHVPEAIVLVNNSTDTEWFQNLTRHAAALCFPAGRVKFLDIEGKPGAPLQGQSILYLGECPERFMEVFQEFGFCCEVRQA